MYRLLVIPFLAILLISCQQPSGSYSLSSPDAKIEVLVGIQEGIPQYSVIVDGDMLIEPSKLGFDLRGGPTLDEALSLNLVDTASNFEIWEQVLGENKQILDHHHSVTFRVSSGDLEYYTLEFKAFNDGIAFRYLFPAWQGVDSLLIEAENTEFNFAGDYLAWWHPNDWDTYEQLYRNTPISESTGANTPVTLRTDGGTHIAIHEANLSDFAGMTVVPVEPGSPHRKAELVPWPDGLRVRSVLPHRSPWRLIQIGRSAADLANSDISLNLNEPNRIEDTSWIKPMKYMGIWWPIHIGKYTFDQGPDHGATTENALHYIDFAAENGFGGLLIEGWNPGWENWGDQDAFRFSEAYDDYDIKRVTDYAAEKGIEIIGHHETGGDAASYDRRVEEGFKFLKAHGIDNVKTGYAGDIYPRGQYHHGQWMVRHYRRIVELAAEYQINLNVHEPIKPTGIRRTWPHMFTREGARGGEYEAWSSGNPPGHTPTLAFTRMLAGPMDYTPGVFHLSLEGFRDTNRVKTTLAHQLALEIVLYSPLQMACDLPEHYDGHPAFKFIKDLKVDWDESDVLAGEVGEYIVTSRRAGDEWFVGAITNQEPRVVETSLAFLEEGKSYQAEIYRDGEDAHWESNPTAYVIESKEVDASTTLALPMAPGGGIAIRIVELEG
jgi:alpha-glucosidase